MESVFSRSENGLTAIELLIFIAFVALLVAFAVPFFNSSLHPSKLEHAVEITEESVQRARRLARAYQTDVFMKIQSQEDPSPLAITLTLPELQRDPALNEVKDEFTLPQGVRLVDGDMVIHFDPRGEVEWPTRIMIASDQTGDTNETLLIA